jgi:nicotinate dehydrogenase subunit B
VNISRREFCRNTGILLIGVSITPVGLAQAQKLSPSLAANPRLDSWLRIGNNGMVTVWPGKCELGQGITTALAQIVADEADVSIQNVAMQAVDTSTSPDEAYTFSSISIQHSGSALRQAAAEMRHILIQNAARRLGVSADRLTASDGTIYRDGRETAETYAGLMTDADFDVDVQGNVRPKAAENYQYVGRSLQRLDLPAKVFAEPSFIQDIRLPGMLHARVVRPALQNQVLIDADADAVLDNPGVLSVIRDGSFLAVVAKREEQAISAAEELRKHSRWQGAELKPAEAQLAQEIRGMPSREYLVHETTNDSDASVRELAADYFRPFTAHASISPAAALALWEDGNLTVWSHGQGMFPLRGAIARTVNLEEQQIRLIHGEAAGCYGHNGADDAACDAAIIAMQVPGVPVRLQWSRYDEFRYEPMGSAMSVQLSAGLDAGNSVTHWHYNVWSGTHSGRPAGAPAAGNLRAARERNKSIAQPKPRSIPQPAGGADRNALPLYSFPNQSIKKHLLQSPPLYVSALRGLGAYLNVFAIETFIEELATAAGEDPLDFRLRYLDDTRAIAVIKSLRAIHTADASPVGENWVAGRGLGFARFKNLSAYVGVVCEAQVNRASGEIRIPQIFASVDAGLVVSPDGLKNQIEGSIVQSTSWTLMEALHYGNESSQSRDWATYPILRFSETPKISLTILDSGNNPSLGAGEAAQGPTAAAIANAVTAACGVRIRELPFTPQRVLAALA